MKIARIFLILGMFAITVSFVDIPQKDGFSSDYDKVGGEISDILWPDDSLIAAKFDRYTKDIYADDAEVRKRINTYKEIINEDNDTLILFICYNGYKPYNTCGWNLRGDTLMVGDAGFMQTKPAEIARFPIMEYVNKWNVDTIAKYWPHFNPPFFKYGPKRFPYSEPDYVFRIMFNRGKVHVEGTEIGEWNDMETDRVEVLRRIREDYCDPIELEEVIVTPKDTLITIPLLKPKKNY